MFKSFNPLAEPPRRALRWGNVVNANMEMWCVVHQEAVPLPLQLKVGERHSETLQLTGNMKDEPTP